MVIPIYNHKPLHIETGWETLVFQTAKDFYARRLKAVFGDFNTTLLQLDLGQNWTTTLRTGSRSAQTASR